MFWDFLILDFYIFGIFGYFEFSGFWIFGFLFFDICSVFCCFVSCLLVVLCFWYTLVVSNVFLRALKTESDVRCTEKAEFTEY